MSAAIEFTRRGEVTFLRAAAAVAFCHPQSGARKGGQVVARGQAGG